MLACSYRRALPTGSSLPGTSCYRILPKAHIRLSHSTAWPWPLRPRRVSRPRRCNASTGSRGRRSHRQTGCPKWGTGEMREEDKVALDWVRSYWSGRGPGGSKGAPPDQPYTRLATHNGHEVPHRVEVEQEPEQPGDPTRSNDAEDRDLARADPGLRCRARDGGKQARGRGEWL